VISGFITAAGLLIAAGQLKHILGIRATATRCPEIVGGLVANPPDQPGPSRIGLAALGFLYVVRLRLKLWLVMLGMGKRAADVITKAGPSSPSALTILAVVRLRSRGARRRGGGGHSAGPADAGAPRDRSRHDPPARGPALLISLIGFVESSRSPRRWPPSAASASCPIRS
jgi:sulfate permease, SulP family